MTDRKYFWLGVIIWVFVVLVGPNEKYPWWVPFLLFPVCWLGAYILMWRGQKDLEWAEKVSWQDKYMDTAPFPKDK